MENNVLNQKTIIVMGIVRNVFNSIEKDVSIIKKALKNFKEVHWFLVESDSSDESVSKLKEISERESNFSFVSLGKIQNSSNSRTIGLSTARNRYLSELRENPKYKTLDYIAVSDFNGLNNKLSHIGIQSCFTRSDWDACFANQLGRYYDIWALRHFLWSPNDCWQQLNFYRKYIKFPERALSLSIKSRMIHIPSGSEWIEVDSAFGGFGIYRRETLEIGTYFGNDFNGIPICEHVSLHLELRKHGKKLFINPSMINARSTDHSRRTYFPSTIYRLSKYPYKLLKKTLTKIK